MLYASPSLWEAMAIVVPMGRRNSPAWEWVQSRLPGATELTLRTGYCGDDSQRNVLAVEQELITAHLLLVLSSAQTCKLRKLTLMPVVMYLHQYPELDGQVAKAISRFNLLTLLNLNSLEVRADTLQVSPECFECS